MTVEVSLDDIPGSNVQVIVSKRLADQGLNPPDYKIVSIDLDTARRVYVFGLEMV